MLFEAVPTKLASPNGRNNGDGKMLSAFVSSEMLIVWRGGMILVCCLDVISKSLSRTSLAISI